MDVSISLLYNNYDVMLSEGNLISKQICIHWQALTTIDSAGQYNRGANATGYGSRGQCLCLVFHEEEIEE